MLYVNPQSIAFYRICFIFLFVWYEVPHHIYINSVISRHTAFTGGGRPFTWSLWLILSLNRHPSRTIDHLQADRKASWHERTTTLGEDWTHRGEWFTSWTKYQQRHRNPNILFNEATCSLAILQILTRFSGFCAFDGLMLTYDNFVWALM